MMILLHYPSLVWYQMVYGGLADEVVDRIDRETRWTPPAGSTPSAGLFQFTRPSWDTATSEQILADFEDVRVNAPKSWGETFRKAGMNADQATASFEAMTKTAARSLARDRLQQEMQGALARGDRKTYKRKLAELRKITPERNDR